jgi:lambda family phage tail tape measure protein
VAQTVEDIVLRLGIKGFDSLDSVRGAFRQLSRVTQASERDITLAREAILNYADAGKVTTRIIDAQIAGLKSLQGQAVINSRTYTQLGADISTLKARFTEATQEVARQTTVLDRQGSRVFGSSVASVKRYTESLRSTRTELAATSRSINATTADVDRLNTSLKAVDNFKLDINVDTTQVTQARGKVASAFAFFKRMTEQAGTPVGATGRIFEGITAGVLAGQATGIGTAAFGGGASALAGLSGRVAELQTGLNKLSGLFGGDLGNKVLGGLSKNLAESSAQFANFQNRIESLSEIANSFTSALSGISPTAAVATGSVITAMAFMRQRVGNELDAVRADIDASFTAITDDIQKLIVELSRLGDYIGRMSMAEIGQQLNRAREAFASVPAGSPRSRSFASQIAGLESVQRGEARAQATVLEEYRDRVRGSSVTVEGLNERLQYLQQRMAGVNRATAEGTEEFRSLAAEATRLQTRITELGRMPTNYAVFAIRQRMAAQRETLAQSGFGAFSSEVRQRYEGIGGVTGERQAAAVREVQEAFGKWEEAYDQMLQVVRDHETAKRAIEEQANREHQARLDHNAVVELAKKKAANDALLAQFDASLKQRDLVARRHSLMAEALGVDGGRELSPLYERVVGLSSSSLRRQQAFMGKSPAEVYNDIVASFETGSRTNLLDNRSQQVGEGIAQGIVKGATDSDTLKKGSKSLVDKYLDFIFGDWDIHSPSGVSRREVGEPIGQGIVKGTVDAIKAGRKQIQAAIQFALGSPAKAPLPGGLGGPVSDVADKLQNFLIRSSARPSATLPFARLLGEGVTNSAALPLATYRRAYERGGIVPPTFLPVEQRRGLRGTAGIPGAGLEEVIRAEAMRAVGRTGAFVGPLASALRREVLQPVTRLSGAVPGISRPSSGATALPVFGTQAPALRQAPGIFAPYDLGRFQTDGPLTRGGQTFGRAAASSSLREALIKYRAATDNFWNGETGTYETLRRIISASAQVGASKLARNLSESRSRSAALSSAASTLIDRVTSPLVTLRTSIQTTAQQAGTKLRSLDIEAVKSVVPTAKQLVDQTLAPIKTLRTSLSTALQQSTTNLRELGSLGLSGLSFGMRGRGGTPPAGGGGNLPPTPPSGPGDSGADRGMDRLNTRLREFGPLSRRSISDLQDLRSVLDELQASLSPLDSDYAALNRQIDKQTAAIDRQLERRDRTRRRPLSGMQMAQGVGAALSGGIFGGPEGLIGGLGGLAFGGVGGAFAGAAAGAQVGMFRQQLAGFADYAASLDKMKIALRGIVKDQASYNTVLAAANAATRELNVPQEAAIGGLTRLSAAILGAGGTVNQSTFAFRALTEAVTATGGKAEQVDGAMLALTQVFSKGKVSAEELNQIAERLPGTYTLFAEATGRTGPQLAKGLEQGKIGLNDLMKFLELLRTKHGQTALEIAASSENAGERLKVAYDKMREDVGRALQPLGAQFQSVFAKALKDATPALINLAQGLAKVIQALGANAGAIALVAKFGVVLTSTIYAGRAFAALGPLVSGAAALMGAAFGRTTAQAIMAERQLKLFAATARATAAALAGPIIISVAIVGADLVIDYFNRIKRAKDRLIQVRSEATGEQFLRDIGGFALDRASVLRVANDVGRRYQVVQDLVVKLQREREQLKKDFEASPSMATYFGAKLNELEPRLQAAIAESALLESRYKTLVRRAPNAPTAPSMPGFAEPPGTAAGAAGAGADAAKQQRDLFQQANEYVNANIELLKARGQLSEEQAATEFDRANLAKKFAIDELTLRKQALDLQKKYNQITPDIYTKSLQTLDVERQKIETAYNKTVAQIGEDISKINEEIFAGLGAPFDQRNVNEFERTLDDLQIRVQRAVVDVSKRGGPAATAFLKRAGELTTADYQRAASRSTVETLTKQITELQRGKGEVTTLDTLIADYGDSWQKLEEPVRKHLEQLATTVDHLKEIQRYKQDPNTYAGLREGALAYVESIGTIRSNVADLAQTGFKGVEDSITSLMTTGTANFREFATSLVADMTRIIVRQFIMRSLMQAIGFLAPSPAASGASGLSAPQLNFSAATANPLAFDPGTRLFAYGGAFDAANRIVPFAYGGVVNKPTMFKFADGGLMRNGVAGEAGPEAIMPLRRLPSGRLGVESSGGGAAPITIQVNVDASGNQQMSGDAGQGQALGRVIAAVVQQELVNQKRPGGLLAS